MTGNLALPRRRARHGGGSIQPSGAYWIRYVLPAMLVYAAFMAYPLVDSVRLSLYSGTTGSREFVGLANYVKLFTDATVSQRFWNAFKNTWVFFAFHMCVQNVLGIFFAAILTNRTMRGSGIYQSIIFTPCTIAVLVTGYLFKLIANPIWAGPTLKSIGLGALVRPWLGDRATALTIISLVSCWQWIGIPTMMFAAAFQGVSDDLLEASDIEGANSVQQFWRVKLPLILPVVGMVAILTFVSNFNAFDVIYSMATPNGAPDYSTDLIGSLFYRLGVAGEHPIGIPEPGLGAAVSTTVFGMLLAGVIPTLRLTQGKE